MHCIVTAGPTYEPLDNVRRLTNFSTGQLGTELAAFLKRAGHRVTLLIGEHATYRGEREADHVEVFTTTTDLKTRLVAQAKETIGAVFHAAAVSDFTFGKIWLRSPEGQLSEMRSGKISTRAGTLLAELAPTPKIIAELRSMYPAACLVGWKFEVDGDRAGVLDLARRQLADCRTDACVANGPAYGNGFAIVRKSGEFEHFDDKPALFEGLARLIRSPQ